MNDGIAIAIVLVVFIPLFVIGRWGIQQIFIVDNKSKGEGIVSFFVSMLLQIPFAFIIVLDEPRVPAFLKKYKKFISPFFLLLINAVLYLWVIASGLFAFYILYLIKNNL